MNRRLANTVQVILMRIITSTRPSMPALKGSSLFRVGWGVREIRRPKSEIRKKIENPKSEPVGLREARNKPGLNRSSFIQTHSLLGKNWRRCTGLLRVSAFGFLSDFGLRISAFAINLFPLKTARSPLKRGEVRAPERSVYSVYAASAA